MDSHNASYPRPDYLGSFPDGTEFYNEFDKLGYDQQTRICWHKKLHFAFYRGPVISAVGESDFLLYTVECASSADGCLLRFPVVEFKSAGIGIIQNPVLFTVLASGGRRVGYMALVVQQAVRIIECFIEQHGVG
jgi:hypothetical protein